MWRTVIGKNALPLSLLTVLIALLAAYAWSAWVQKSLVGRIIELEVQTTEQRNTLNAALGHVLPVHMPLSWEDRLEDLERRSFEAELWPANAIQAGQFFDELSALIQDLSPLAEANYFSRLAWLRWTAVAFDALHRERGPNETLFSLADQMRAIADAKPTGIEDIGSNLDEQLRSRAEEIQTKAEAAVFDDALEQARRYLDDAETVQHDLSLSRLNAASVDEIYDTLALYEDRPAWKDEVKDVRKKLETHMLEREAQLLHDRWTATKDLAASNDPTYEVAANILLSEVTVARTNAALQSLDTSSYDNLVLQIQSDVVDRQDGIRRRYQEWALKRIMAFEERQKEIDSLSGGIMTGDGDGGEKNGEEDVLNRFMVFFDTIPDKYEEVRESLEDAVAGRRCTNERCREMREAIVIYLLPIKEALLDLPILKRYQREFDEGWDYLNGHNEQTCVAIAVALVKKRTFHDFQDHHSESRIGETSELWKGQGCVQ